LAEVSALFSGTTIRLAAASQNVPSPLWTLSGHKPIIHPDLASPPDRTDSTLGENS
jgi:hypothetical protein